MRKLILIGHGEFASGLGSSLKMIMGDQKTILAIDQGQDIDFKTIEFLDEYLLEDVCVGCDLLGGSPFLKIAQYIPPTIPIVGGINIPFALEFLSTTTSIESLVSEKNLQVALFRLHEINNIHEIEGI